MRRLLTFISIMAIGISANAQTNGIQIKKTKIILDQTLNKNKKVSIKYDLNKLAFLSKSPLNQIHFEWDNNNWEFNYNSDIEYHGDGRKKSESLKDQVNNEFSRFSYTYDNQNRLVEIFSEMKSNSGWQPYLSTIIQYNSQGDITKYEDRIWANNNWGVINGLAYDIVYDAINQTKSTVESYFDGFKYDTSMKYIEYKNGNYIISEESQQFIGQNSFIPIEKFDYLYENNVDTGLLKLIWDGISWREDLLYCNYTWSTPTKEFLSNSNVYIKLGSDWYLYQREKYTQENYGGFSYLLQDYASGNWIENMRIFTLNDSLTNRTDYIYDLFLNGTWQQLFRIEETYVYDNEGNITEHVYKETDSNGDLLPIYKDIFSNYILLTGLNDIKFNSIVVYPNPAQQNIKINDESFVGKAYQIVNLNGKVLQEGKIESDLSINLNAFADGVYILKSAQSFAKIIISNQR